MMSMILLAGVTVVLGLASGFYVISVIPKFWIRKSAQW